MIPSRIIGIGNYSSNLSESNNNRSTNLSCSRLGLLPAMSGWSERDSYECIELNSEMESPCDIVITNLNNEDNLVSSPKEENKVLPKIVTPNDDLNLPFTRLRSMSFNPNSAPAFTKTNGEIDTTLRKFSSSRSSSNLAGKEKSQDEPRSQPDSSNHKPCQMPSSFQEKFRKSLQRTTKKMAYDLTSTTSPDLADSDFVKKKLKFSDESDVNRSPRTVHSLKMLDENFISITDDYEMSSFGSKTVCECCRKKFISFKDNLDVCRTFNLRRNPIRFMIKNPRNENKDKKDCKKRQVYVCVIFLKIGEIDTIKEQYAADILIKSKWREPDMDQKHDRPEYDWTHSWTPKLYVENTIGEAKEQIYQMITFNEFGHAFLVEKRRVSGIFLENLELDHFPFDVQDLTVTVASNLSTSEIRLVNDPDEPHRINKQSFVDEQEWYLYKHIETEQHELSHEYAEAESVRPALSVKCRAARRPAYFIWNIFLVTFLICSLSLVTFCVDRENPQNRLQLTFTLVLTLVAFKFVVNQCLPKISYLTYLDKYVISSLFILTLICIWHGMINIIDRVAKHYELDLPPYMEFYIIAFISVAYIAYNVGFILMIYCVACHRRRIMTHRDMEYVEKVKCQMKTKSVRTMRLTQQAHQIHEVKENGTSTFI